MFGDVFYRLFRRRFNQAVITVINLINMTPEGRSQAGAFIGLGKSVVRFNKLLGVEVVLGHA